MKSWIQGVRISAVSSVLPRARHDVKEVGQLDSTDACSRITQVTGIKAVRWVDDTTTASDLCLLATELLLEDLQIDRSSVDALLFISQSRDHVMPMSAAILQHKLGLGSSVLALDIPAGCAGYIQGLLVAASLMKTGARSVLLLAGETNSKLINPLDRSLTMIFGDGGSATLLEPDSNSEMYLSVMTDGAEHESLIIPAGGCRYPASAQSAEVSPRETGNLRSDNDMFMDGMAVFNFAVNAVPKLIMQTLHEMDLSIKDISMLGLHQANDLIVKYIRRKTGASPEQAPFTAGEHGNTGPASIPILMSMLAAQHDSSEWHRAMLAGFGVGLAWGTAVCDLSKTRFLPVHIAD